MPSTNYARLKPGTGGQNSLTSQARLGASRSRTLYLMDVNSTRLSEHGREGVELCSTERVKRAWTAPSRYINLGTVAVAVARDLAETTGDSSRLHLRPEAQLNTAQTKTREHENLALIIRR
ncbi:hypothetical protein VP1G_10532 [Cytospora mali]|uniref:Uncharacterized protein n=1 Tax=Cytospora mali TaxID=578113 RepID=A0A194UN04_CYTMA|nr:hypothetical protein VP1G_10532 [Valsa mali var. pyri (nom. inval.)]